MTSAEPVQDTLIGEHGEVQTDIFGQIADAEAEQARATHPQETTMYRVADRPRATPTADGGIRTTADLTAAAVNRHPSLPDPNYNYHRDQFRAAFIAADERAAYAEDARRGLRGRLVNALAGAGRLDRLPDYRDLVDLAEAGDLVDAAHVLATVPDRFGRTSPFALYVRVASTGREYATRNLDLPTAVRLAKAEQVRGNRPTIGFDVCG